MQEKIEYIVTLKNKNDLEQFYCDMESDACDKEYIPKRKLKSCNKRPISRNTHYYLTPEEACRLKLDDRVMDIIPASMLSNSIHPLWEQTSAWDRSASVSSSHKNWGLKRCVEAMNVENWGSEVGKNSLNNSVSSVDLNGRNVDVIVIDGHFDPSHPEFSVNANGTGGSRVVQYNWFSLNNLVSQIDDDLVQETQSTEYIYLPYSDIGNVQRTLDNNHGCHVAGIAAGNTHGWAKKSNIYNINPYGSNINGEIPQLLMWDYIRAFHQTKSINPETGRKNPTVCNCSYGSSIRFPNSTGYTTGKITYVSYRGDIVSNPSGLDYQQLIDNKIYSSPSVNYVEVPFFSAAVAVDIEDAIADGIIVVGAAGNESFRVVTSTSVDYGNFFNATYEEIEYAWYYHRGTTPSAVAGVICVGATSAISSETKSSLSNCGERIDVFAPGENVMSSVNSLLYTTGANDPRNSSYKITKYSGTSMSSPQVTGVIACILERSPNMKQQDIASFIQLNSKTTVLNNQSDDASDTSSLQGAQNRMLYYRNDRKARGTMYYPSINANVRSISGVTYPRTTRKITR